MDNMDEIYLSEEIITEETFSHNIKVSKVEVTPDEHFERLDKPVGNYITVEFPMDVNTAELYEDLVTVTTDKLRALMNLKPTDSVLVVGIGNRNILADSFGPRTVDKVEVTTHLIERGRSELRAVNAICPGTTGQTGLVTLRIIQALVKEVNPSCVIVVDAICTDDLERMATTIQMNDTGISPGLGLGMAQTKINKDSLGVPVYAIGVPTVVEVASIMIGCFEALGAGGISVTSILGEDEVEDIIRHAMKDVPNGDAVLALKDVEYVINNLSEVIAQAINHVLLGEAYGELY